MTSQVMSMWYHDFTLCRWYHDITHDVNNMISWYHMNGQVVSSTQQHAPHDTVLETHTAVSLHARDIKRRHMASHVTLWRQPSLRKLEVAYSSVHVFFFFGLGFGQRTARMASSNTVFSPFWVSAEHSRYFTELISFAIARPCRVGGAKIKYLWADYT